MQKPTIGRIVVFTDIYGVEWPAIIVCVGRYSTAHIDLTVFKREGARPRLCVPEWSADDPDRTWRWPSRDGG